MKKAWLLIICLFLTASLFSQTRLSGTVLNKSKEAIIGANVYIDGTYDGTITDEKGQFSFETTATDSVVFVISYIGYETMYFSGLVASFQDRNFTIKEAFSVMNAVEVSGSTFKAGDNSKVSVLKPLDILTTAGSMGDVMAALQTLPGTQSNPEDGRLFVRGGDARESQIYVDGLRVFSPYSRTIGGTPSRGRYSPMLFKGVSFSTGGYSAGFGQALSGVLDMNTIDQPTDTETNISLMTVGLGLGHTMLGDRQSLSFNTSYVNLSAYNWLVPGRADWIKPYRAFSGEAVYRYKTENGLFKSYWALDNGNFSLYQQDIDSTSPQKIAISNNNWYGNSTYRTTIGDHHSFYWGLSVGRNKDFIDLDNQQNVDQQLNGWHSRLGLKTIVKDHFILNYGLDWYQQTDDFLNHSNTEEFFVDSKVQRSISSAFIESDYFLSKDLAFKAGLRLEHHSITDEVQLSPRVTLAQKLGEKGQISMAYGQFYQEVDQNLLFFDQELYQEKASHYLLNYNWKNEKNILRLEGYYKDYDGLVQFDGTEFFPEDLHNGGDGYAYGFDVFWRANQVVRNVDFWVSYSWLEHQRQHRNFPTRATPNFATQHNLSLVSKTWINKLRSQIGLTYNIISGRPYENPNTIGFLNEQGKVYQNLSMSWSYLVSQQSILFVSASNILNRKNNYGYRYAQMPDINGIYPGELIRPNDDQFFFVGFFLTISSDKMKNQLDNL